MVIHNKYLIDVNRNASLANLHLRVTIADCYVEGDFSMPVNRVSRSAL